MEHIWKINNLEREIINGKITTASYSCNSNHNGYGNREIGDVHLPDIDPEDETFLPYGSLTESIVLDWVNNLMTTSSVELTASSSIASRINADNSKIYDDGLPWE